MRTNAVKRIVIDVETTLDHKTIWLCCTKNIDTGEKFTWYQAKALQDYIADATLLIGHNLIFFDCHVLNRLWRTKIALAQCYDTLLVSRLLSPSREGGHSLAEWGNTLGTQKIDYKAVWQWLQGRREEYEGECYDKPHMPLLAVYCERDVDVTELLYRHLVAETEAQKFSNESVELEHAVAAIIAQQERNGFKLDVPYANFLVTTLKTRLDALLERSLLLYPNYTVERYSDKTGKRLKDAEIVFSISSRQQVAKKLQELGWAPDKHTEKGSIIVDEGVLDEIIKSCESS